MANPHKLPKTPGQDPTYNQSPRKVVGSDERVENADKPTQPEARDMGDVVAEDSTAQDGVKQTP